MPVQAFIMAAVLVAASLFLLSIKRFPVLSFFLVIGFAAIAYSFAPLIREIFTKVR